MAVVGTRPLEVGVQGGRADIEEYAGNQRDVV